ncbi:fungal-specific transcription factor domain-containing protein [Xylogone sp. PMI_703]|nr:fungal-specific transcription factor domain-containing protein [Xylogone sp. PMI_703]
MSRPLVFPQAPEALSSDPALPGFSTANEPSWQGWDDGEFWQNLFNSLPPDDLSFVLNDEETADSVSRKRRREDSPGPPTPTEASRWMNNAFPELEPSNWLLASRTWPSHIPNPFLQKEISLHPRLRTHSAPVTLPEDGRIDGLIKVRLNYTKKMGTQPIGRLQSNPLTRSRSAVVNPVASSASNSGSTNNLLAPVTFLPPDFGRGLRLKPMDEKLFNFYLVAICGAVTLIPSPSNNCYLTEIAPIAARNECVKHAVLALSATYILDYSREDHVKTRANFHWRRAVHLLTQELNDEGTCHPGKEDTVVAALVLFSHNENVCWERDQERQEEPAWYRASRLAEQILDKSDPLYRYRFPSNVQCSGARNQFGNKIALYNIMSATMWPLNSEEERCPFVWLLEGDERELRKINGCTGLSPRLVHSFAQITHLSMKLYKDPNRLTAQRLGKAIAERLDNFWQWSDLSQGYATSQQLIDSCILNEDGYISDPVKATELLAETYAGAAQVYLYCRLMRFTASRSVFFFGYLVLWVEFTNEECRKPRKHPRVQEVVTRLLWCIRRLPTSGPLFTAQHAQLRVVLAAVVAVTPAHRTQITDWFEGLVKGTRGNVPPVWRAVKSMWTWLDVKFEDLESREQVWSGEFEVEVESDAWWEEMVRDIFQKEGKLNLA